MQIHQMRSTVKNFSSFCLSDEENDDDPGAKLPAFWFDPFAKAFALVVPRLKFFIGA